MGKSSSNHPFSGAILVSGRVVFFFPGLLRHHGFSIRTTFFPDPQVFASQGTSTWAASWCTAWWCVHSITRAFTSLLWRGTDLDWTWTEVVCFFLSWSNTFPTGTHQSEMKCFGDFFVLLILFFGVVFISHGQIRKVNFCGENWSPSQKRTLLGGSSQDL